MRTMIIALGLVLCGCSSGTSAVRYGITTVPVDRATANETVADAVQKSLDAKDEKCVAHLIDRSKPKVTSPSSTVQVATAVVCEQVQQFSVTITHGAADQATISAHRIK